MNESPKRNGDEIARSLMEEPLELPDGTAFSAVAPKMTVLEMIALSERYLPILNSRPDFVEKKRKAAFGVPFTL